MVFYLGYSVYEEFSEEASPGRKMTSLEKKFFEKMAISWADGNCFLCGDLNSLQYLADTLQGTPQEDYKIICNQFSQHGPVMDMVSLVIVLTMDEKKEQEMLPENLSPDGKTRFLSIQELIQPSERWDLDKPCCLLSENLEDCKFYKYVVEYYCTKKSLYGIRSNLDSISGGGSDVSKNLIHSVRENHKLTLCIYDSDQKFGEMKDCTPSKGGTSQNIEKVRDELKKEKAPFHCYCLGVHEVENLIPLCVLRDLSEEDSNLKPGVERLERLKEVRPDDARLKGFRKGDPVLYYDLKHGFPYIEEDKKEWRLYWEIIRQSLDEETEEIPKVNPNAKKAKKKKRANKDLCFPAVSDSILTRANEYLKDKEDNDCLSEIQLEPYLSDFWDEIGNLMLTWGCAAEPRVEKIEENIVSSPK